MSLLIKEKPKALALTRPQNIEDDYLEDFKTQFTLDVGLSEKKAQFVW
jgi:hypothetical protein